MILISRERQRVKVQGPSGVAPSREQREPIFDVLRVGKWDRSLQSPRAQSWEEILSPLFRKLLGMIECFYSISKFESSGIK